VEEGQNKRYKDKGWLFLGEETRYTCANRDKDTNTKIG